MNRVIIIGRLVKDPDLRYTSSGVPVASFTLAVNRNHTNQNGERETDFINIVVWNKQAENVNKYLSKGSQCAVDGRIQTRNYDNNEGKKVYVTEIVAESVQFLNTKNNESTTNNNYQQQSEPMKEQPSIVAPRVVL